MNYFSDILSPGESANTTSSKATPNKRTVLESPEKTPQSPSLRLPSRSALPPKQSIHSSILRGIGKKGMVDKNDGMNERVPQSFVYPEAVSFDNGTEASLPYTERNQCKPEQNDSNTADFVQSFRQGLISAPANTEDLISLRAMKACPSNKPSNGNSDCNTKMDDLVVGRDIVDIITADSSQNDIESVKVDSETNNNIYGKTEDASSTGSQSSPLSPESKSFLSYFPLNFNHHIHTGNTADTDVDTQKNLPFHHEKENGTDGTSNAAISQLIMPLMTTGVSQMGNQPSVPSTSTIDTNTAGAKPSSLSALNSIQFSPRVLEVFRILSQFDAYEVFLVDEFIHSTIFDVDRGTCNGVGFYDGGNKIMKQELLKELLQRMEEAVKKQRSKGRRKTTGNMSDQPRTFMSGVNNENKEPQLKSPSDSNVTVRCFPCDPGEATSRKQHTTLNEGPTEMKSLTNKTKIVSKSQLHDKYNPSFSRLSSEPVSCTDTCPSREKQRSIRPSMCKTATAEKRPSSMEENSPKPPSPMLASKYTSHTDACSFLANQSSINRVKDIMQKNLKSKSMNQKHWKKNSCQHEARTALDKHACKKLKKNKISSIACHQPSSSSLVIPLFPPYSPCATTQKGSEKTRSSRRMSIKKKQRNKSTLMHTNFTEHHVQNRLEDRSKCKTSSSMLPKKINRDGQELVTPKMMNDSYQRVTDESPPVKEVHDFHLSCEEEKETYATAETDTDESDISSLNCARGSDDRNKNEGGGTNSKRPELQESVFVNRDLGNYNYSQQESNTHSPSKRRACIVQTKKRKIHKKENSSKPQKPGLDKFKLILESIRSDIEREKSDLKRHEPGPVKQNLKMQKPGLTGCNRKRIFVEHDYCDHAKDDSIHQKSLERKRASEKNFPESLHNMLSDAEKCGYSDIVSWQAHGRAFRVHKPEMFVEKIMPFYFRQTKLTSFQRQLNLYDFRRITGAGKDKGAYYHELFLKGRPDLVFSMKRLRVKGTGYKASASPDKEPNFYAMSPVGTSTDG